MSLPVIKTKIINVVGHQPQLKVNKCQPLGLGNFAVAYKTDLLTGDSQAVKTPRPERGLVGRQLLQRDAQILSMILHPNLVKIESIGTCVDENFHDAVNGSVVPFVSYELIEGKSFMHYIDQKWQISPVKALEFGLQIASALKEFHDRGYLYNDIKPDNIIHDAKNGRAVLIDPSLFSREGTHDGKVLGAMKYMSPEKRFKGITERSADIFALGITLYEMMSGKKVLTQAAHGPEDHKAGHEDLREEIGRSGLPQIVKGVLLKALEYDKEKRFKDAEEFMRVAEEALSVLEKKEPSLKEAVA